MKHIHGRKKIIAIGLAVALLAIAGLATVASAQGPTSPGYGWGHRYGGMMNGWGYSYGGTTNGWGYHRGDPDDMPGYYGGMRGGYGSGGYPNYGSMRGGYGSYGSMRGRYGYGSYSYGGMRGWGYRGH